MCGFIIELKYVCSEKLNIELHYIRMESKYYIWATKIEVKREQDREAKADFIGYQSRKTKIVVVKTICVRTEPSTNVDFFKRNDICLQLF